LGALTVVFARGLAQPVAAGDGPVLGAAPARAPAAVPAAAGQRPVERGAVGAGLPARDDRDVRARRGRHRPSRKLRASSFWGASSSTRRNAPSASVRSPPFQYALPRSRRAETLVGSRRTPSRSRPIAPR